MLVVLNNELFAGALSVKGTLLFDWKTQFWFPPTSMLPTAVIVFPLLALLFCTITKSTSCVVGAFMYHCELLDPFSVIGAANPP